MLIGPFIGSHVQKYVSSRGLMSMVPHEKDRTDMNFLASTPIVSQRDRAAAVNHIISGNAACRAG